LVSLLVARQLGHGALFWLWIPLAHTVALVGRGTPPGKVIPLAGPRFAIQEAWQNNAPDTLARMKRAGITLLYVDRLNGSPVPLPADVGPPLFDRPDFAVYRVP